MERKDGVNDEEREGREVSSERRRKVEGLTLCKLGRAAIQSLFKQVPCSLQLLSSL